MSDSIDAEERRTEIALFRYTLVLPLLRGDYEPGGKGRLREQIAASYYEIPHSSRRTVSAPTLGRWERRYNQDGFDGLKPKRRSDRDQPRAISPDTLDRAEALKRQQPCRSSRSIVKALTLDATQPIPEEMIAPRTLRRQLALRDATTAQLLQQPPYPLGGTLLRSNDHLAARCSQSLTVFGWGFRSHNDENGRLISRVDKLPIRGNLSAGC